MAPPEAPVTGFEGRSAGSAPAVSVCALYPLETLRKRAEFLRAAQARRQGTPGFLLQARPRRPDEPVPPDLIRVGFTCSKKLGNAVARNRAKRRLRAIARAVLPQSARPGWDYVLVGRPGATAERDFAALLADLSRALTQIHKDMA
ncbi:ribonuclease P protein component [Rhodobacter veldkampii DSM 11550]|uniref:Ribonuclease P protein component n=1 Tax=Phaeovulum veldkampii DSM 11550 TaxID=1185920 RepID=A0A2T4JKA8_9RHOB|nr:ribonuclease P protein component [Phaeovulum veldkampii]MBK5946098.1 ribonuclease P protein component [Phaeovulum veldkampii DSM 11550]NCU19227.1 ribonuclease P protein component [Candidatus Falkowbacteria bacterium]PTE18197.1 ribonuclease P protein component [Phaeovulum veldkampii DSM 11550]